MAAARRWHSRCTFSSTVFSTTNLQQGSASHVCRNVGSPGRGSISRWIRRQTCLPARLHACQAEAAAARHACMLVCPLHFSRRSHAHAPVHVRGAQLADAVHPAHRLRLHRGIQLRLHQHHVLSLSEVQPIGALLHQQQQHLRLALLGRSRGALAGPASSGRVGRGQGGKQAEGPSADEALAGAATGTRQPGQAAPAARWGEAELRYTGCQSPRQAAVSVLRAANTRLPGGEGSRVSAARGQHQAAWRRGQPCQCCAGPTPGCLAERAARLGRTRALRLRPWPPGARCGSRLRRPQTSCPTWDRGGAGRWRPARGCTAWEGQEGGGWGTPRAGEGVRQMHPLQPGLCEQRTTIETCIGQQAGRGRLAVLSTLSRRTLTTQHPTHLSRWRRQVRGWWGPGG